MSQIVCFRQLTETTARNFCNLQRTIAFRGRPAGVVLFHEPEGAISRTGTGELPLPPTTAG